MNEEKKNEIDENIEVIEDLKRVYNKKRVIGVVIFIIIVLTIFIFILFALNGENKGTKLDNENKENKENITPEIDNENSDNEKVDNEIIFVGKFDKYTVYKQKNGYGDYIFYVDDENGNRYGARLSEDGNENYLYFFGENIEVILNMKDSVVLDARKATYNCSFFSSVRFRVCLNDTIIFKGDKFGVISLKNKEILIEKKYDQIAQDTNGNFLVKSNDKYGLFNSKGQVLLEVKYDYLGYSDILGYITILGNDLIAYDLELKEKPFVTEIEETVDIINSSSYYWSSGSLAIYYDINKAYGENEVFKYTGSDYTGNQLVIYDNYAGCSNHPIMYVIKDNKAYIIDSKEITVNKLYCF